MTGDFNLSFDRDDLLGKILGIGISNQAALQVILGNQAKLFSKMFPEKTIEEHYDDFTASYTQAVLELNIQLIKES